MTTLSLALFLWTWVGRYSAHASAFIHTQHCPVLGLQNRPQIKGVLKGRFSLCFTFQVRRVLALTKTQRTLLSSVKKKTLWYRIHVYSYKSLQHRSHMHLCLVTLCADAFSTFFRLVEWGRSILKKGGRGVSSVPPLPPVFNFTIVPGIYSRMGVVPHLVPPRL